MLCWMCGKTRRDRIINDNVREKERVGALPREDGGN